MDLQLADLGTTFAIGAYVIATIEVLFLIFLGKNVLQAINLTGLIGGATRASVVLGILSFAVGMLSEDLSNKFADVDPPRACQFKDFILHPDCSLTNYLLDSEKELRRDALMKPNGALNPLGSELHALGAFSAHAGNPGLDLEEHLATHPKGAIDPKRMEGVANALYYFAKNTVYREDNHYDELKHIQIRIDFSRSLAIVSCFMIVFALVLSIVAAIRDALDRQQSKSRRPPTYRYFCRAIGSVSFLVLAFLAARLAYAAEELEFNKRVFGYFASLQRAEQNAPRESGTVPGISGMVYVAKTGFLTVHDFKSGDARARIGRLRVTDRGTPYESMSTDWSATGEPSDLEAVCIDPVHPDELLAAESGPTRTGPGRLFRLQIDIDVDKATVSLRARNTVLLPADTANVEGMACARGEKDATLIVLGERGDPGRGKRGRLRWAQLTAATSALNVIGEVDLVPPDPEWREPVKGHRDISDLYLDERGSLWAVAATDPNRDTGPFESLVYPAGSVTATGVSLAASPTVRHRIQGFKVEALAAPLIPESMFSMGTDDEGFGGTWRPLR